MGHSSVAITLERYGHLMPGNETEAASLLEAQGRQNLAVIEGGFEVWEKRSRPVASR